MADTYIKEGECSHCGKCCLVPYVNATPVVGPGEDRCKFYTDTLVDQNYGHCLIYGRKKNVSIEKVVDRFGNIITKEQIDWFYSNCTEYPTVEDVEKEVTPPIECSFIFR